MKKMSIIQFSILALISCVVAVMTFATGGLAANHWNELFNGGKVTIPSITVFLTHYGYIFPLTCCICSIIYIIVSIRRSDSLHSLWQPYSVIVISELLFLAFFAWANVYPALKIMYRL